MTQPTEKDIDRIIQNLHCPASRQLDQRMDTLFGKAEDQPAPGRSRNTEIWSALLQRKIIRYIAAAIIIAIVFFGLYSPIGQEPGPGKLYAMGDLPALLHQARSVHIQGWITAPRSDIPMQQQERKPFEYWFDAARGQMRLRQTAASQADSEAITIDQETVIDGSYLMTINHTEQSVRYQKMGDFARRYLVRQSFDGLLGQLFLTIQQAGQLTKTGTDIIDQKEYEIWEGTFTLPSPDKPIIQIKAWFDPIRGNLGRMKIWQDRENKQTIIVEITQIQRNLEIPADLFSLQPPRGYTAQNTKEQTKEISGEMSIGNYHFGSYGLHLHIAFRLIDGTVLLAWSGENRDQSFAYESIYRDLQPGDPLPRLPVTVEKLIPVFTECPTVYPGHHLAYTHRNNRWMEWSVYVPQEICQQNPITFKLIQHIADPEIHKQWKPEAMISTAFTIEDDVDFQEFVIGAMTELSDPGAALPELTYADVLALTQSLREWSPEQD